MIKPLIKYLHYYFLFGFFCFPILMKGQSTTKFERINDKEGDFQSIVYTIGQDSFGNIWAGTEEGVIRYNSKRTFHYNKYRGLSGNTSNRILTLLVDAQSQIWIGTDDGLSLYNPLKDKFEYIDPSDLRGPVTVQKIINGQDGILWLGASNGLWKFDRTIEGKDKFQHFLPDLSINSLLLEGNRLLVGSTKGLKIFQTSAGTIHSILNNKELKNNNITSLYKGQNVILVGTGESGLYKANPDFDQIEKIKLFPGTKDFRINDILSDEKSNLYIGTDGGGLLYLNKEFQVLDVYKNDVDNAYSISSNGLYDVLLGKENILWVATYGGGLNKIELSKNNFSNIAHQMNDLNSIGHDFTRAILEDKQGRVWFGTKAGISIWNRQDNTWDHIPRIGETGQETDIVMALAEDGDYIWATTYGRGAFKIAKSNYSTIQYNDGNGDVKIGLSKVYAVMIDRQKNCWLGGIDGNVQRIDANGQVTAFSIKNVRSILEKEDGTILLAGRNGVHLIRNEVVTEIESLEPGKGTLDYTSLNCISEDAKGNLIIGTNGAGLIFYNEQNKTPHTLHRGNGMPSDVIQGILQYDEENLWISTTQGLANITISPKDTIIKIFNKSDGLNSTEFNYGSFSKLKDGTFLFGGVNGVTYFDPAQITSKKEVPKVVFEELHLFNKKIQPDEKPLTGNINFVDRLELNHQEHSLSIKFIGILQSNPENVKYSWKMDGVSNSWSEPTTEDQINFTNLASGKYIFSVKAANRDGVWGPQRQLAFTIATPWWATTWAYILYFLIGLVIIAALFYLGGVIINKQNADEQIAFFNNITHELKTPLAILLSTLDSSAPSENGANDHNKKIKSTVSRLNTLFDQLLNFSKVTSGNYQKLVVTKIPLKAHVQQTVNNFSPLLGKRSLTIEIKDEWSKEIFYYDKEVLDKILFNLISNAVKYSTDNGSIKVTLVDGKKGELKLSVEDDGIGIPKDQQKFILKRYYRGRNVINSQLPGTGLGLMIVKNLVERDEGSISFNSIENEGTTFTVILKNHEKQYHTFAIKEEATAGVADIRENTKISEFSEAKILVVEDNDELRQIIVDRIGVFFQVFEAENGRRGLELVGEIFPDLILTDLIMPEMDGLAMCQVLKEDINTNHIPVFMMTVLNNPAQKIESIESGISAYMEKPINFDFLLAKMVSTLSFQKNLREKYLHQVEIDASEKYRNKRDAEFINNLEKFVLEQAKEETLSVHDLCKFVGMSRTALYMKLKNLIDLSPQNFIIHTRLKFARQLLVESDINVKEVAYRAGFSNPKYFSTSFKKLFGESPTSFLKGLQSGDK